MAEVQAVDLVILSAFEDLLGSALTSDQAAQASLPLRVGGCGLRCPLVMRPAARIAALATFHSSSAELVGVPEYAREIRSATLDPVLADLAAQLGPNCDPITRWQGTHSALETASKEHQRQSWWAERLGARSMHVLLDSSTPRDQARLLEQAGGFGSCFMGIIPNRNLNSVIPTDTYRLALRWWLGCPLLEYDAQNPPLCPGCQVAVDPHGDHLLCCRRINFTRRHQAMQEALAGVLTDAGQPFEREVQIPSCPDGQLRPADILLRSWTGG